MYIEVYAYICIVKVCKGYKTKGSEGESEGGEGTNVEKVNCVREKVGGCRGQKE